MRRSLLGRQFVFIVAILVLAVAGTVFISSRLTHRALIEETSRELERQRILFEEIIRGEFTDADIDSIAKSVGAMTGIRFTVIAHDGRVIADSERPPQTMDSHADRPEIVSALTDGEGVNVRYSTTLRREMVYLAAVSRDDEGVLRFAVRASKPMDAIIEVNAALTRNSLFWGIILISIAGLALFGSRRLVRRSISDVSTGVKRIAQGDFSRRLDRGRYAEFEELENSVNSLAEKLQTAFGELEKQRANLLAILQSLGEGVLVLDGHGAVILMNEMAQNFTDLRIEDVRGKDFLSTSMIPELRRLVEDNDAITVEYTRGDMRFKARKILIPQLSQTVITIGDITESHIVQQTKTDFVANVSHELKTPLTLIKGFAETLEMEQLEPELRSYIATIIRHTDRMIALVEDLLTLSRIERANGIQSEEIDTAMLTERIIMLFKTKAEAKRISLGFDIPFACPSIYGDESLLEIALSNLVDNAVKYTPEGGNVRIEVSKNDASMTIAVVDDGFGIPPEDQSRVFERFYTVDKSRSNALYGTGLGLSIVKHIAMLHSGKITLISIPGEGSRFELCLPIIS